MKIYYFSPDSNDPIGGIKVIYQHVDILNQNGYKAYVIHTKKNFRCTWFENSTPIVYAKNTSLKEDDYLVIPEIYASSFFYKKNNRDKIRKWFHRERDKHSIINLVNQPCKKIIFNQNSYYTFENLSIERKENFSPYPSQYIKAILSISEENKEYLQYIIEDIPIYRVKWSYKKKIFEFQENKKKQICFMPRKNSDHAQRVINTLYARGKMNGFNIIPIQNKTEKEVAEILKESLIFLSFGYPEGCPLPPAEAMLSGCLVIGYNGGGGKEYFNPDYCYPIPFGDILTFAQTIENIIKDYPANQSLIEEKTKKAQQYIEKNYSTEKEKEDLLYAWQDIINIS